MQHVEPRLTCALNWISRYLPEDERTQIRSTFDEETYQQLAEQDSLGIRLLVEDMATNWNLPYWP